MVAAVGVAREERFIIIFSPADYLEKRAVAAKFVTGSGFLNINEY